MPCPHTHNLGSVLVTHAWILQPQSPALLKSKSNNLFIVWPNFYQRNYFFFWLEENMKLWNQAWSALNAVRSVLPTWSTKYYYFIFILHIYCLIQLFVKGPHTDYCPKLSLLQLQYKINMLKWLFCWISYRKKLRIIWLAKKFQNN